MKGWSNGWNHPGPRCPRSRGPVGPGPFGGRRQPLEPRFGRCPRVTSPGVAPPQRASPERRVGGIPTEPRSPRNGSRPAPPRPRVAGKTWSRAARLLRWDGRGAHWACSEPGEPQPGRRGLLAGRRHPCRARLGRQPLSAPAPS